MDAKIGSLWNRVQRNEESQEQRQMIAQEAKSLLESPDLSRYQESKLRLILLKTGANEDIDKIIEGFDEFIKLEPDVTDAWICSAESYIHKGDYESAINTLDFVVSENPTPAAYVLLSLCMRKQQVPNRVKSLEYAKEAIKLDMKNGEAWASYGLANLSFNDTDHIRTAAKAFKMALENGESNNADILVNYGTVCEILLDYKEALAAYEAAFIITNGWTIPRANLERLRAIMYQAAQRADVVQNKMRKKRKAELISRLKGDSQLIPVEGSSDSRAPAQTVICLDRAGDAYVLGVNQTMRQYIRLEKSTIEVKDPVIEDIQVGDRKVRYIKIKDQRNLSIHNAANPNEVKSISIGSSVV